MAGGLLALTSSGDKDDRAHVNGYVALYGAKLNAGRTGRLVNRESSGGPNFRLNLFYVRAS